MPNIRTYNAGDLALHPTETGIDATVQAGRRISQAYDDVASTERQTGNAAAEAIGSGIKATGDAYVAYQDHQQISAGMPAAANLLLTLQQQANNITKTADPNNPAVYGHFRDEVLEPALQEFQQAFTTENSQRWAMEQANGIRQHMQHVVTADMSTMAAQAVSLNLAQTANIASNTVFQDPTALPFTLDMLKHSTGATVASSPNISPEDAVRVNGEVLQRLNEKVVRAAIQGAIAKNPEVGLKMAQDPQYAKYIDGAEANSLYQQTVRAQRVDSELARSRARQELEERSTENLNNVIKNLYDPAQTNKITAAQIAQLPDNQMRPGDREHAIKLIDAELKPQSEAKQSAIVANDALAGIRKGTVDLDQIYQLKEENKITRADFTFLQGQYTTYRDESGNSLPKKRAAFVDTFKHVIDSSNEFTGTTDEIGKQHLWDFEQELSRRESELRKAGQDPHSLYDPRSPNFMGSPAALAPYKKTAAEEQAAAFSSIRAAAPVAPPKPADVDIPKVQSAADVEKLPPTARYFLTPNGRRKINPNYKAQQ